MELLYCVCCVWTGWFVRSSNWQRCSLSRSCRTRSVVNNRSTHALENTHISVKLYRVTTTLWEYGCVVWRHCSDYHSVCNNTFAGPVAQSALTELWAGRSGIGSRWGRDIPPVQTGPRAHPASSKMGTGSFPGVKCGRGVLLTTHPLLVSRSWKSRAIPLPTLWATPGL